jgi:endonuclease YncB( thermonuclease family)
MPRRSPFILVVLLVLGPLQGCGTAGGLAPTPAPAVAIAPAMAAIPTFPPTWTPRPPTPTSTRVIPLTATFTPGPSPTPTRLPMRSKALVVDVQDAYTLEVLLDGQPVSRVFSVRLAGVERPLLSDPWSGPAVEWLTREVTRQMVVLESDEAERDAQGNLLRYVWKGGRMVNVTMVQLGLLTASPSAGELRYGPDLLAAQADAQSARRGVWGPPPKATATPGPLPAITATVAITTTPIATLPPTSTPSK